MKNEFNIDNLKIYFQQIMQLITSKKFQEAKKKLAETEEFINEIIDHAEMDRDLVAISKYQILLIKLQKQLESLN
jgi:hypothetical protein